MKRQCFETNDLSIATTLSLFFPIENIDKTNPRKALFIFDRRKELDDLIDRYWKKELLIEPRAYFDNLKALKARIYGNE